MYNITASLPQPEGVESYAQKFLIYSLLWSFTGDAKLSVRNELGDFLRSCSTIQMPGSSMPLIDYEVITLINITLLIELEVITSTHLIDYVR